MCTELSKSQRVIFEKPQDKHQAMKNKINPNWIGADFQSRIKPQPIVFFKKYYLEDHQTNIIKVKMWHNYRAPEELQEGDWQDQNHNRLQTD